MKIGILTYHRVVNDGSIMQAYCGQKAISQQFPEARVEIIDYSPAKLWWTERRGFIRKWPPFIRPQAWIRISNVKKFIDKHLVLSPESCCTDNLEKAIAFIKKQNYDAVFVGSDTVWEARYSNYVPEPPNAYYLPDLKSVKKIAYAASSDPLHPNFLSNKQLLDSISQHVKAFDYITIRDKSTEAYIKQNRLTHQPLHFMPDPTLQYDFSGLVQKPAIVKKRPWAGIGFGGDVKSAATTQLKEKGYDIVDIGGKTLNGIPIPGAKTSLAVRLGIFSMLDFLITDRFHSSIFTLKLAGAPVVFVESSSKWPEPDSKGRDLFERLGIGHMVWRYEGGKIPSDLIDNHLKIWQGIKNGLPSKFTSLKSHAQNQMKAIRNLLP